MTSHREYYLNDVMNVGVVLTAGDVTSGSSVLSDVCFREWKWACLRSITTSEGLL